MSLSISQSINLSITQSMQCVNEKKPRPRLSRPTHGLPVQSGWFIIIRPSALQARASPAGPSASPPPCALLPAPAPLAMRRRPARAAALEAKPVRHPSRTSTRSPPRRGRWHGPACLRGCQCQPSSAATPGLPFAVDLPRSVKSPSIRPPVSRPAVSHGDDRGLARRGSCQMQQNRTP